MEPVAASPASFHPSKAATSTASVSSGHPSCSGSRRRPSSANSVISPAYDRRSRALRRFAQSHAVGLCVGNAQVAPRRDRPWVAWSPCLKPVFARRCWTRCASASSSRTARWAPCCRPRTSPWTTSRASRAATRFSTSPGPTSCARCTTPTSGPARTQSRRTRSAPTGPTSVSTTSSSGSANWPGPAPRWPRRSPTGGRRTDRPRWVLGSLGPGTKLPTLGHVHYRVLRDAYQEQVAGMIEGGADAIIVETCQDLLQAEVGDHRREASDGRCRCAASADRARHGRDDRNDAAGLRDRGGAHRAGAARHRRHRAQLRHRSSRDERAPALSLAQFAPPGVGDAQRGAARTRPQRRHLSVDRTRVGHRAGVVRQRIRHRAGRRLLRHDTRAHQRRSRRRRIAVAARPAGLTRSRPSPRCTSRCPSARTPAC